MIDVLLLLGLIFLVLWLIGKALGPWEEPRRARQIYAYRRGAVATWETEEARQTLAAGPAGREQAGAAGPGAARGR